MASIELDNKRRAARRRNLQSVPNEAVQQHVKDVISRRLVEADLFTRLADQPVKKNRSAQEALQNCLDEAIHEQAFFMHAIENLTPQQLAWQSPNKKILALVHQLRAEVASVSATMIKLGLDERETEVQEKQVEMIVRALDGALQRAGVSEEQRSLIGRELRLLSPAAGE